jgi:Phosphotransferase enzyme family
MALEIDDLSNDDIARLCNSTQSTGLAHCGRSFTKLTPDVIVKYGWSVTADEAANQKHAYLHSPGTKINVPKVYRYFRQSNVGYLVMEFIDGISLEKILLQEHPELIRNLAEAIHAFATKVPPDFPGPRNSGIPRGYLFSEDGAGKPLSTMKDLNSWLGERARLTAAEPGFGFQLSDCVFCHMDLSRRNIIVQDEFFCILDWEYAGFYPREFERYCILFIGQKEDYNFAYDLTNALDSMYRKSGMKIEDEHITGLLDRVYRNNLIYNLYVHSECSNDSKLPKLTKLSTVPTRQR